MVHYICLVGCKNQPVDGYVSVCLVLAIDVCAYNRQTFCCLFKGSGCDSVGRVVVSNNRDPRFESNHRIFGY